MAYEPQPAQREERVLHCTFNSGPNNDVDIGKGNDFGSFLGVTLLTEDDMNNDLAITGFDIRPIPEEKRDGRRLLLCFELGVQMTLHLLPNSSGSVAGNQLLIGLDVTGDGTVEFSHDMWDGYTLEFVYNATLGVWCPIGNLAPF
jgi:hypothetical protein